MPSSTMPTVGLPEGTRACLFDVDGVLTKTATIHARVWKRIFDDSLRDLSRRTGTPFAPFTLADYTRYVDGRLRVDGARAFFESRGIRLPEPAIVAITDHKDALFLDALQRDPVEPYEGSVRFVHAVRDAGMKTAVVSASRHCEAVLASAGIADLFDARIDGNVADAEHLAGKPAPDTFLAAAHALGVEHEHAVVFEDALAGVEAGHAGHFGYVVGVDRAGQAEALREHGADIVVTDLAALLEAPR